MISEPPWDKKIKKLRLNQEVNAFHVESEDILAWNSKWNIS